MKYILLVLVAFTLATFKIKAQRIIQKSELVGLVTDQSGHPLASASIFIHDVKSGAMTDSAGKFRIYPIRSGHYLVEVTYQGFASLIIPMDISGTTFKQFWLSTTAVEQEAVTVTGVSSATRLKTNPQPVSLVKKSDLMQNATSSIIGALARKGGVSVLSTGPAIAKPIIRGLGYNRVVTINDGVRQEGQQWGDEHGIEIDEASVQRAEILKGPASLMYGSDAIAGVINLITNQTLPPSTVQGNVSYKYMSNNRMTGMYTNLSGNLKNGINWNAYGSFKSAGDYRNKYDGYVLNSRFNEHNLGGYAGVNKSWGYSHLLVSSFNQKVGLTEGIRDPSTGEFIIYAETPLEAVATDKQLHSRQVFTPYQHIKHSKVSLDNSLSLGGSRLTATVALQRNQRQEYGDPFAPQAADLYFDLKTLSYNLQLQTAMYHGWKNTFGLNGMYQQNSNKAPEKIIPEYSLFDAGIFAYTSKNFNKVHLSGGVRGDMRSMHIEGLTEDNKQIFAPLQRTFGNISASAGIAYEASKALTVKANVARGYRSPTAAELSSNGAHEGTYRYEYGNSDLKTENSLQADLGIEAVNQHISVGISAFYNHLSNYIYYSRLQNASGLDSLVENDGTTFEAFRFNQSSASLTGFEVNLDIHPHPLDWLHFENTLSFVAGSFYKAVAGSKNLPFMPPAHLISELRGNFLPKGRLLRNLFVKVEIDATARQKRVFAAYNTETATPGYALLNLGTGTDFTSGKKTLFTLYFNANNITGKAYQNHLSRLKYTDVNNATGRRGVFNTGRSFNITMNVPFTLKAK